MRFRFNIMTYSEVLKNARKYIKANCNCCPVCNGVACKNRMPGPGSKGSGTGAARNYNAWQRWHINMNTMHDQFTPDPRLDFLGQSFALPLFAGPVGSVNQHYGDKYSDSEYNRILVEACAKSGIAAFVGDSVHDSVIARSIEAIARVNGRAVPTIKPWHMDEALSRVARFKKARPFAMAMDIDAAGLPFLKDIAPPTCSKNVQDLRQIAKESGVPFIIKGIMTANAASRAIKAEASAIIVSNHGGRVLDGCAPTAEVLPEIANAVGDRMPVIVDGGIRSGQDMFKALALGADAVIIARPFVNAVFGGGAEGVSVYIEKLAAEFIDTMSMAGARTLADITPDMVRAADWS